MLRIFSRGVCVTEISGPVDSQLAASAMKSLVREIACALVDETDKVLVEVLVGSLQPGTDALRRVVGESNCNLSNKR